jgi:hypothetical protein
MRFSGWVYLLVLLGAGRAGCSPSQPTSPAPQPSPTYSPGRPNATAFENLQLVRSLETASGRSTILTSISGWGIAQDGRVASGNAWEYFFTEGRERSYDWNVTSTGEVILRGPYAWSSRFEPTDLTQALAIDSDQAILLGLKGGAQAFVDRYPQTAVTARVRVQAGVPTWELRFQDTTRGPLCGVVVFINSQTGELLGRDLSCLATAQ